MTRSSLRKVSYTSKETRWYRKRFPPHTTAQTLKVSETFRVYSHECSGPSTVGNDLYPLQRAAACILEADRAARRRKDCCAHATEKREGTIAAILDGLRAISPPPTVFFGGIGVPLAHPKTIDKIAAGFAEFQPLDPEKTEDAYRRNRRIELKLTER